MHTIAVAGHICLDISPVLPKGISVTPGRLSEIGPVAISAGGSVSNTGGAFAALGATVSAYADIGSDVLGEILLRELDDLGLDTGGIARRPDAFTSYSIVIEQPGADRSFWHHTGASSSFDGAQLDVGDARVLHLGYPSLLPALLEQDGAPLRDLLARARTAGVTTSVDLAVIDPSSGAGRLDWDAILSAIGPECDILSPSLDDLTSALNLEEDFSEELVERMAQRLLTAGVAVAAISAGPHGLFVRTASESRLASAGRALAPMSSRWCDRSVHAPSMAALPFSTSNGAGDAASAGLVFGMSAGASIGDAAALATACSSVVMGGTRPTPARIIQIAPALAPLFEGASA